MDDLLEPLIELEEAGVCDVRRAGCAIALSIAPRVPLLSVPARLRMALSARRAYRLVQDDPEVQTLDQRSERTLHPRGTRSIKVGTGMTRGSKRISKQTSHPISDAREAKKR